MSGYLERGFTVPVWVISQGGWWPEEWMSAWAKPCLSLWVADEDLTFSGHESSQCDDRFRPRDPNDADRSDRPDPTEAP